MSPPKYVPYDVCYFHDTFSLDGKDEYFYVANLRWNVQTVQRVKAGKNIVESKLVFKPKNVAAFCGVWKIVGRLVLKAAGTKQILMEISFCCNDLHPFHKFESDTLLGKDIDYEMWFNNLTGMGVTPRPNYFEPNDMTDVCLLLGEGEERVKLHLSKAVLAHFSEFFKTMFFANFTESSKSEVELKDVYSKNFIDLLDLCFGAFLFPNGAVYEDWIENLFVLADRFLMPAVTEKLQLFLVDDYGEAANRSIRHLIWADKFKLPLLMARVMQYFTLQDAKCLQKMKDIRDLRPTTFMAVLKVVTEGESSDET